ncbi:hypothetical protein ACEQ8H_003158 [Pleosporales sp. CAS-2024a]
MGSLALTTDDMADAWPLSPDLDPANNSHSLALAHVPPPSSPSSPPATHQGNEDNARASSSQERAGLGIAPDNATRRTFTISHAPERRPVALGPLSPLGSANPFVDNDHDASAENTPDLRRDRFSPHVTVSTFDDDFGRGDSKNARQSTGSVNEYQQYLQSPDTDRLRPVPSIKSAYENDFRPTHECPTAKDFYRSGFTWFYTTVVIICLFSCVFSAIFVGLAIREPFWGRHITSHGPLTPANANLLTQIFAKLIELSFVTSFVSFLGQVLSRRAFMKGHGRGVTLSELSMWRWVVQPGTLVTHWETAKYAGPTILGILSLVCAVVATLYSSASTALVQPTLRQGSWKDTAMSGRVETDFANITYVKGMCQTPIRNDKVNQGSTCLQIEHAGQAYHNYQRYLADWSIAASHGNGSTDQRTRPPGFGLLYENTTVTAQWIDVINTTQVSKKFGRAINNVSLALPHAGVFEAAHSSRNGILQPEELNSEGTYSLNASVPSPVLHVLCANMNEDELAPIVYSTWPANQTVTISNWRSPGLQDNATTTNKTKVDDIFGWKTDDPTDTTNYPPVFAKYPLPFNTLMNHTSHQWGRSAIYLLAQGGLNDDNNMTGIYSLCKIEMSITPNCMTQYNVRSGGGTMNSYCEDRAGDMSYGKLNPDARSIVGVPNWRDVGFDWANALSLETGIMDGQASNSRILSQMMLNPTNADPENYQVNLSPVLPSMGEALAVMAGCTLLMSSTDAPFTTNPWNDYDAAISEKPLQYFNASISAQQYASGGIEDAAARAWLVVLVLVLLLNVFVLAYFLLHRGFVTDFSEPPNLFALAVNSPPSHVLAGSCGGGPEGEQYMVNWFVNHEGDHLFMEPGGEKSALLGSNLRAHTQHGPVLVEPSNQGYPGTAAGFMASVRHRLGWKSRPPIKVSQPAGTERLRVNTLQSRPSSFSGSEYELAEGGDGRVRKKYAKLANRRSML